MTRIRILFVVVFVLMAQWLRAQADLIVQGTSPQLYVVHTVVAKENWYSIGRLYNISPKEIAPFNGASMDKPLSIGESLKIPLTAMNFSQDGNKAGDEVLVPLRHVVQEKEWLYRISQAHNKVPVANLEQWNNVTNDQLKQGMKLIVGYLKVKTGQSALAAGGITKPVTVSTAPVAKTETPKTTPAPQETAKTEPVKTETTTTPSAQETVKKESVKESAPVTTGGTSSANTETAKPVVKEEPRTTPTPVSTTPEINTSNNAPVNYKGGYFRKMYKEDGKGTAGNAGIFRSTSGWNDGKYYALMNGVPVGTIVKVSFSSTNKSVYAKVLGLLPEMKESVGLTIRLSDAAASELGATNPKFYVDVKY